MFITIGGISKFVGEDSGLVLITSGAARKSSESEAYEAMMSAIARTDTSLRQIVESYHRIYGSR